MGFIAYRLLMGVDTPVGYTLPDMVPVSYTHLLGKDTEPTITTSAVQRDASLHGGCFFAAFGLFRQTGVYTFTSSYACVPMPRASAVSMLSLIHI